MNSSNQPLALFAHGKESGPWGSKIIRLAQVAKDYGFAVDSPDYSDLDDAGDRIERLLARQPAGAPLVVYGSSMGGYVSAMACQALRPDALFLLAPALYLPGYPGEPASCPGDTVVVHGWRDNIVPCDQSLRFARERHAALHLVDDGHRLIDSLDLIARLFEQQLRRVSAAA